MKELYKYTGILKSFDPDSESSVVILKDPITGKSHEINGDSLKMKENGIDRNGCEFEILIMENNDGKLEGILKKIKPEEEFII